MVIQIKPQGNLENYHCLISAVYLAGFYTVEFCMDVYGCLKFKDKIAFNDANTIICKHCHVCEDDVLFYKKRDRFLFRNLSLDYPAIILVDNHYVYSPGDDRYLGFVDKMLGEVVAIWPLV